MSAYRSAKRPQGDGRSVQEADKVRGPPTRPRPASTTVLCVQSIGPLSEPLFGEGSLFFLSSLGKTFEVPPLRIRMTDHNNGHALSRAERQGRLWLEQAVLVSGFNGSHRSMILPAEFLSDHTSQGLLQQFVLFLDVLAKDRVNQTLVVAASRRMHLVPEPPENLIVETDGNPRLSRGHRRHWSPSGSAEIVSSSHLPLSYCRRCSWSFPVQRMRRILSRRRLSSSRPHSHSGSPATRAPICTFVHQVNSLGQPCPSSG